VITDKDAQQLDISKYSYMVYGTIKNNLLLQKFQNDWPISVTDTCIHADKDYYISDGKVIFNFPNPLNHDKFFIIYTAQKPEYIIGINGVRHGSTNYVVSGEDNKILKSGYVLKVGENWICL
jgi:hypothetical protein